MPCWKKITVEKAIVDIGVSVYEHNLIAILTYSPHPTRITYSNIEIILVELSTGKPHPLAKHPILFISETRASKPSILLEIVGDYLVLVMVHKLRESSRPDVLQVYEWKTGALKMDIQRPHLTYREFVFLSQTMILLPNYYLNTLDIWELPTGAQLPPAEPFLRLTLPTLSTGSSIINFSCRCEPNPTPSGTPHLVTPFHPDPDDAIMVMNVQLQGPDGVGVYLLFVHRSALLKVCTTHRPEDEDGVSHYIPGTFTIERIPGKRVRAWDDWGPPITRVFDPCWGSLRWITTTSGQRAIVSHVEDPDEDVDEDEGGQHPRLLDFNPYTVKKAMRSSNEGLRQFEFSDLELDSTATIINCIDRPILGQLPYVEIDIPFQDSWLNSHKGFLLYEEGFIVLDDDDRDEDIEIFHVGLSA
ncbi:hypothetical protein C0992_013100 [Termitomyces sp. T32_za158]|nr:hypothetical protein C0992_013100 [Termitomyces sp. T32_za158]